MKNLNVSIKILQAKDAKEGRIGDKYLGSLDYSLLTDYIESQESLKEIIRTEGERKYSDEIISVRFDYAWEGNNPYNQIHYVPTQEENKDYLTYIEWNNTYKENHEKLSKKLKEKLEELKENKKQTRKYIIKEFNKDNKLYNSYKDLKVAKSKATKNKIEFDKETEYKLAKKEYKLKLQEYIKNNDEFQMLINGCIEKENNISNLKRNKKKQLREIKSSYTKSTKQLRQDLYENGFTIGDKHYVRFIRSSGSARVGKCLFINEKYYNKLMDWIYSGIDVKGQEIDLASFESYISLVASGSVGRFKLESRNILLINDYYSNFLNDKDTMVTRLINIKYNEKNEIIDGDLETTRERLNISNNIFDGEALLDSSIFKSCEINRIPTDLSEKATMQVRNKFYKGQAIQCNIQQFYKNYFKENYETAVLKDMFGNEILAKDVLLITTPSSLKYLKYFKDEKEGYNKWKEIASEEWAICKYDKPTHHFEGMTQTHYQLLNSLGLSRDRMKDLLKDTIDYINLLKTDNRVFKYNVNIKADLPEDYVINSKDRMIRALLTWNEDFINTKVCWDYRKKMVQSYIDNVRKGHVLVEGNYSIVCNNVVEMLYASVGDLVEIDGRLQIKDKLELKLEGYEAISMKFENGEKIAAVRSPQPSMANVGVYTNKRGEDDLYYQELSKYFNLKSKEVIFTNSINVNKMEKFSSEDFDIDSELITNNPIIVEYANKIQRFAVNNDLTPKTPNPRVRTSKNLSDVDVECSVSRIGEVINLVQALNSVYWDSIKQGKKHEELEELYKDICQLNSLSCIEIDRCKKTSIVNTAKELKKIREKGYLKDGVKPNFMKWCNEYEQGEKKPKYHKFEAGMDYLEDIISDKIVELEDIEYMKLSSIIKKDKEANRGTVKKAIEIINRYLNEINKLYADKTLTKKEKDKWAYEIEMLCVKDPAVIKKLKDIKVVKSILKRCEKYEKYTKEIRKITRSLKTEIDLERVYELHKDLEKFMKLQEQFNQYKSFRRILKIIFLIDKAILLDCFKNKAKEYEKKPYILYGYEKLI
ncbi:hypothetical protein [Clostridium saudiense]|uniref:hypothetical protein n=1 Tax=Clostridium saudiense TaxID=1414720 RepID=UPI0018A9A5B8|nr:hypothetical protein [Clostridium saudiense]